MSNTKKPAISLSTSLFTLIITFSILGLIFIFDASLGEGYATFNNQYYFLKQHGLWLAVGLLATLIGYLIPIKLWKKFNKVIYLIGLIALVSVFIPGIGKAFNGAHRWLFIGQLRFQPIEFFKLAMIVYFADWLTKHQKILPFLFSIGLPTVLIIFQPDLGSLLILCLIAFSLFFLAGGKITHIVGLTLMAVILTSLAIFTSSYRWERFKTFINPASDPLGSGFHIRQITLALGRGGLFGQGIGNSAQKYAYIPEASTDSIFAIIAEEIGFIGSLVVIIFYGLFFFVISKIILKTKQQSFAYFLGWGILIWIAGQTILNLSAVVALVPLTGIPLPFLSYGGSSLIMVMLTSGILLRINKEND